MSLIFKFCVIGSYLKVGVVSDDTTQLKKLHGAITNKAYKQGHFYNRKRLKNTLKLSEIAYIYS